MIVRFLLAALAAGLIAGMAMTPAQYVKLVPLILHAETYEHAETGHDHAETPHEQGGAQAAFVSESRTEKSDAGEQAAHAPDGQVAHAQGGEETVLGFGRLGNTILANIVAGCGFALLLAGVALLSGFVFPTGRDGVIRGLMLGAAGWFCVQLAPSFSLPPELPGFPYVDLLDRQIWWLTTVGLSAAGVWLMVIRRERLLNGLGLALIVAPHVWGAPQPVDIASEVPAMLASEFASAALATTLFFWLVLGGCLGHFLSRVGEEEVL